MEKAVDVIKEYQRRILIMRLFLEGQKIEFQSRQVWDKTWYTSNDPNWEPSWDWDHYNFRVKEQ